MLHAYRSGMEDIRAGLRMQSVWTTLASEDISDQHRRTFLGPAWLLLNYLAFAGAFIIIFNQSSQIENFPAYVAIGLYVWLYLAETVTQSVTLFVREESFIKGTTLPLSVYVLRMTMQTTIRAGYSLIGCLGILLFSGHFPDYSWLWSMVAVLLIMVTTPAVIVILAIFGAFFADLQFFVSNIMRAGMFLTPIFWIDTGSEGLRATIYNWNPFTYFLEIVRSPIYSGTVSQNSLLICGVICLAMWIVAVPLLGKLRKKIAFVL